MFGLFSSLYPAWKRCKDSLLAEEIAETGESTLRDGAYVYWRTLPVWNAVNPGSIVFAGDAPRRGFHHVDRGVFRDYVHELSGEAKLFSMKGMLLALLLIRGRERLEAGGHCREEIREDASRYTTREAEYTHIADYSRAVRQGWDGVDLMGVPR
jgi:hypothetical protein